MSWLAPTTTKSARFTATTNPARISLGRPGKWKPSTQSNRKENHMDTLIEQLEESAKKDRALESEDSIALQPPKPKSQGKLRLLLAGGLFVAVAASTFAYTHYRGRVSTDDAQVDAHIAPIAPKISGNVVEILVDDNQQV